MNPFLRVISQALSVGIPAAILVAVLFGIISLIGKKVLWAVLMFPTCALMMLLVGALLSHLAKLLFKADQQTVKDTFIFGGFIVGGSLSLVTVVYIGADAVWASRGALLGGLSGVFATLYQAETTRQKHNLAARSVVQAEELLKAAGKGDSEDVEDSLKEVLLKCEVGIGSIHRSTATVVRTLAKYYRLKSRLVATETLLKRALAVYRELAPGTELEEADCLHEMCQVLLQRGQSNEALSISRRAVSLLSDNLPKSDPRLADAHLTLARLNHESGKKADAVKHGEEALTLLSDNLGRNSPQVLTAMGELIEYNLDSKRYSRARELLLENLALRKEMGLEDAPEMVDLLVSLARLERERDHEEAAITAYRRALEQVKTHGGPYHPSTEEVLQACVSYLIPDGWKQNAVEFWTALVGNDQNKAKLLLDDDPELCHLKDIGGWSALHWCCFWDMERLLEALLFRGAPAHDAEKPPHLVAARWGRRKLLITLLSRGAEVDSTDEEGRTCFLIAALAGDQRTLELLLHRNSKINETDFQGKSALHYLAAAGDDRIVVELISRGAPIDQTDKLGRTPLHYAAEKGHLNVCQRLLFNGAKAEVLSEDKKEPADLAREWGHESVAAFIETHRGDA